MNYTFVFVVLIGIFAGIFPHAQCLAEPPQVSNIQVQQRAGSYLVDITYDLFDPDGDSMYVSAVVSINGDDHWGVPCRAVDGDAGFVGNSGTGKNIAYLKKRIEPF